MEMSVEAFVRLLASEALPAVKENELRQAIRNAMRQHAENQIRVALVTAIKACRLEARSLIARIPFALAPSSEFNALDWLMNDESQAAARALLGRPGPSDGTTQAESKGKPEPTQRWQEKAILDAISTLGLNPQDIAVTNGKRGPKADIRAWLRARDRAATWSEAVFNKAWRRLVDSESIRVRVIR